MVVALFTKEYFRLIIICIIFSRTLKINLWVFTISENSNHLLFLSSSFTEALLFITYLVFILILLATSVIKNNQILLNTFLAISWSVFYIFKASSSVEFYIIFEASLIPIFLMVIAWGYQPERLSARISLFLYTVCASLPLILVLFMFFSKLDWIRFNLIFLLYGSTPATNLWALILTLGFLVKVPIFGLHLWLPKAHVEAPVFGSIILAAVLLKLGGVGLYRFRCFIINNNLLKTLIFRLSLIGGAWIRVLCARQRDIKVLIAYSSVAHISLVIARFFTFSFIGLWASLRIIIAHAFSSSGIFLGANLMYLRSHTRIIFINKNVLNVLPLFSLFWFLLSIANMGGPPTFNLLSEIINIKLIINWSYSSILSLVLLTGMAVAYTLILYSITQHRNKFSLAKESVGLTQLETINLFVHSRLCFWTIFLINTIF